MSNFIKTKVGKTTSVLVGLTTAMWLIAGALVVPMSASAATTEETIAALLAQIQALQAQLNSLQATPATSTAGKCAFTRPLTVGSRGDDVKCLQEYLTSTGDYTFSGGATGFFGNVTRAAVASWQSDNGVSPAAGYFGSISRAKYNELVSVVIPPVSSASSASSVSSVPPVTGGGLMISAAAQPAATLAVENAARLPFTRVTFVAGDQDVTVNGVNIERTGLAIDSVFSGVVLLDENGLQLGIAKTLNSNHQAVIGDPFVVRAGQSRTMTVAGNMGSSLDNQAGQVAYLSVLGANTSATVSGNLPITGAGHTINGSLSIGSVSMQRGGIDPGSSQTKEIGITGYTFSSVRVTAGSQEDVILRSIRWNQTGSAAATDLANLKTYIDGTAYETVVSSNGQYYTATFGSGVEIKKGFSVDVSIRGDLVGGSNRTVDFDIAKRTDIDLFGKLYGYGIIPPQTGSSVPTADTAAFSSSEDPWYDAAQVTISKGTMTVSSNTAVAAQNIAVNLSNQPLGGYTVEVRGEPISVGQMIFNVTANGDQVANITSITLVDQNGAILAGPADGSGAAQNGTVTFTDTVTFPVGITNLTLKGKLGTTFSTNDTVQASTTPSTQWTSAKGLTTGNSITPNPTSAVSGNTMTVKAGSLSISVSSQPTARSVIAGANQFEFARYIFDASQSGEDVRITNIPLLLALATVSATNLTNCQIYDGATSVTTGSNVVNPSAAGDSTFTFDGTGLMIPKQSSKTLALKCNVSTAATSGTIRWGLTDNSSTFSSATGVTSGQTVTETMNAAAGQLMTAATGGAYTVSNVSDTDTLYKIAQAGATDVIIGKFRFEAGTQEDIMVKQIALQLGNTASNSPADLVGQKVSLWNASTNVKVGDAQFGLSAGDNATSTLSSPVTITKGGDVTLIVKGDLSAQDAVQGTPGAFLAVDYDGNNNGLNGNYSTGVDSGSTISGTSGDTSSSGLRVFRTIPTVEDVTAATSLTAGNDMYSIKITAGSGRDIGLRSLRFNVATTGATVTGFQLFGPSGTVNSTAVNAVGAAGSETVSIVFDDTNIDRIISAGTSKTYRLRANTVSGLTSANTETLNVALRGDSAYPSLPSLMGTVNQIGTSASTTDNFVWTPFSTTTSQAVAAINSNLDWTNGFGVKNFPLGDNFAIRAFKD